MALPKKDYFRVIELAAEWECSIEDIFHHFLHNRIRLGIQVYGKTLYGLDEELHTVGVYNVSGVITIPKVCTETWELGGEEVSLAGGLIVESDYPPEIVEASYLDETSFLPSIFSWALGRDWENPETDYSLITRFVVGKDDLYPIKKSDVVIHFVERDRFEHRQLEAKREIELDPRAETTYLNIIGGLVKLLLEKSPAGKPHSVFENQTAIISALLAHFPDKPGIKQRTLEEKFAAANRSLNAT